MDDLIKEGDVKTTTISPSCVGCGYCCCKAPCCLAVQGHGFTKLHRLYEDGGACPELSWNGQQYRCDLAAGDARYAAALYIGAGCCSSMNSDRTDIPSPDRRGRKVKRRNRE